MPEACHVRLKPQAHLFLKLSLQPGPMLGARDRGDPLGGGDYTWAVKKVEG